jgi:hypothetical protein
MNGEERTVTVIAAKRSRGFTPKVNRLRAGKKIGILHERIASNDELSPIVTA